MTTSSKSIAAQLAVISSIKKTKTHLSRNATPSLLFNSKEASEIDDDTITTIGVQGFTELKNIDDRFEPFGESIIFAHDNDFFDRRLLSKEENAKIDERLTSLLSLVSHHFLNSSSHKLIEFLLRRYQIHQYNTTSTLECILPYHETKLFARMLQLVWLDDKRWEFLKNAQAKGFTVSRATMIKHCVKNLGFLQYICDLVLKQALYKGKPNSNVLSFCSIILIQSIYAMSTSKGKTKINENNLREIISFVKSGILTQNPKIQLVSYMILSQLLAYTTLSTDALYPLLLTLSNHVTDTDSAIQCISNIFASQTDINIEKNDIEIPETFFYNLLKIEDLCESMKRVVNNISTRFLKLFINFFKTKKNKIETEKQKIIFNLLKNTRKVNKKRSLTKMNMDKDFGKNKNFERSVNINMSMSKSNDFSLCSLVLKKISKNYFNCISFDKQNELIVTLSECNIRGHDLTFMIRSKIPQLSIKEMNYTNIFADLTNKIDRIFKDKSLPSVVYLSHKRQRPLEYLFSIVLHILEFLSISLLHITDNNENEQYITTNSLPVILFKLLDSLYIYKFNNDIIINSCIDDCIEYIFDDLVKILKLMKNEPQDLERTKKKKKSNNQFVFLPTYEMIKTVSKIFISTSTNINNSDISPSFRNNTLLLLGEIGCLSPDLSIHALNPLLNMMGNIDFTEKLDEILSFSVLQQYIQVLFPPLINFCDDKKTNLVYNDVSMKIINVFLDNIEKIPVSRRKVLMVLVIGTLGETHILDTLSNIIEIILNKEDSNLFAHKLLEEFSSIQQLHTLVSLLKKSSLSMIKKAKFLSLHLSQSNIVSFLNRIDIIKIAGERSMMPWEKINTNITKGKDNNEFIQISLWINLINELFVIDGMRRSTTRPYPDNNKHNHNSTSTLITLILEKLLDNTAFTGIFHLLIREKDVETRRIFKLLEILNQRLNIIESDSEFHEQYKYLVPCLHDILKANYLKKSSVGGKVLDCIIIIFTNYTMNLDREFVLNTFVKTLFACMGKNSLENLSLDVFKYLCTKPEFKVFQENILSLFFKETRELSKSKLVFQFLSDIFKALDRSIIQSLRSTAYDFYISIFNFMVTNANDNSNDGEIDLNLSNNNMVFVSFIELILRFTESELIDLISMLKEWASINLIKVESEREEKEDQDDCVDDNYKDKDKKHQIFCSIIYNLNEKLTILLLPYFTELLPFFLMRLSTSQSSYALKTCILQCLTSLFSYIPSNYIGRDRFSKIKNPLIDNVITNNSSVTKELVICIVKLANVISYDPYILEFLTNELLTHINNDNSIIKERVLNIIHEIFISLGHSYLFLLPNLMPHIYNCLNDNSDIVKRTSFLLRKTIERLSGEDLDKYLK